MKGDADPAGVAELRELRSCTEGRGVEGWGGWGVSLRKDKTQDQSHSW